MKLSKEARATKNEYMRQWRKRNADRVKMYQKRYWEKKAQEKKNVKTLCGNRGRGGEVF